MELAVFRVLIKTVIAVIDIPENPGSFQQRSHLRKQIKFLEIQFAGDFSSLLIPIIFGCILQTVLDQFLEQIEYLIRAVGKKILDMIILRIRRSLGESGKNGCPAPPDRILW